MKTRYTDLIRWHILYIVLLVFLPSRGYSQEEGSCAEKLKSAQTFFDRGQVELVPSMLTECMKSGFNREESPLAYKLLIQTYLFEDKLELADSTMLAFLKKNPEYEVSPTDHSSFVNLFNNFRVKPVVQISIHLGTNLPFLTITQVITQNSIHGENFYGTNALNLFGSVEAKFELSKKLELNIESGYSELSFTNSEEFMGFKTTTYTEKQKRIEVPVSLTFNYLTFGKFTAYGRLGQGAAFYLGPVAKPSYDANDDNNPNSFSGADIDRNNSRIKIDIFTQAGTGLKFKTRGGFIFTEVRSNFGFFNQNVKGQPDAEELRWRFNHEDDDFRMNTLNFNFGYTLIIYKPLKRKE